LLIDQTGQHLANHREVSSMAGILPLQVDEIGRRCLKTLRQEARHDKCRIGIRPQEFSALGIFTNDRRRGSADGCGVR
jgi:hypothetical protein